MKPVFKGQTKDKPLEKVSQFDRCPFVKNGRSSHDNEAVTKDNGHFGTISLGDLGSLTWEDRTPLWTMTMNLFSNNNLINTKMCKLEDQCSIIAVFPLALMMMIMMKNSV